MERLDYFEYLPVLLNEQKEKAASKVDERPAAKPILPPTGHVDRNRRNVPDRDGATESLRGQSSSDAHTEYRDGPLDQPWDHVVCSRGILGKAGQQMAKEM